MSDNDTKSIGPNAKKSGALAQEFSEDSRLGAAIAKASPEARQQIQEQTKLAEQVLANNAKWQLDTREDRIAKERSRLLERYMNDPAPRPNSPEARQNDLKTIEEQAARRITERDEFRLENTKREAKSYVYEILRNDRTQSQQHTHDFEHDQGH